MTAARDEVEASGVTPPKPTGAPPNADPVRVGASAAARPSGVRVGRSPWRRVGQRASRATFGSIAVAGSLLMASCGGGGGDDNPTAVSGPPGGPTAAPADTPIAPYTVSGKATAGQTQTVDTDTNDPNQPGHRSNNAFSTVQALPNPGLASGYLTVAGGGPAGAVSVAGDLVDGYSATLQAGQVIELDFSGNTAQVDVDLFLYDENRALVGRSIGTNSYECIRVTTAGNFVIAAQLYAQGSTTGTLYQLSVSAPGSSSCANTQTTPASLDPEGVIALAREDGSPMVPAAKAYRAGLTVVDAAGSAHGGPMLLQVPSEDRAMGAVFAALSPASATADAASVRGKALEAATGDPGWRDGLSAQARRAHAAIDLSKSLMRSGRYRGAEPNLQVTAFADRMQAFPPNDREYSVQRWHYEMISLPAAANRLAALTPQPTTPSIAAVIDSGIVANHPDLQGQLIAGYDFIVSPNNGDGDGIDNNPDDATTEFDWGFHGTHVAGTIAAQTYNGIGVAGVAPVARIMPIRVLSANGSGTFWDLQQALAFAGGLPNSSGTTAARRADVINLSLGATGGSCADAPALQELFNQLRAAGVFVVAAAGNESASRDMPVSTPANCANVFAVGAVEAQRRRSYYSNIGPQLAIAAPGGDVTQHTTGNASGDGVYSTMAKMSGTTREPTYGFMQGTSMASPHAAGVIALVRWINPQLTPATFEQWLREGRIVDDLGTPGRDETFGYGLINADKAVAAAIESLGGGTPPPAGQISAQPTALNLGSVGQTVEFNLVLSGTGGETIAAVAADAASISVAPKAGAVDATTGLGTYVVTANRAAMADNTTAFPNVVIRLTPERTLTVPVTIERRGAANTAGGSVGPIYVVALDAGGTTRTTVAQFDATAATNGDYTYSLTVPGTRKIAIVAGSDLDNDGYICGNGEACGAYPNISGIVQVLEPTGNLTGIDFPIAPSGGVNAGSLGPSGFGVIEAAGIKR